MSIYIFHGDGIGESRKLLQEQIANEKSQDFDIKFVEGDKIAPRDLESILSTSNLFSKESLVIEHLLGRLRSKDKDTCIELIAKYSGDKNILLWDKKEITQPNLKKLTTAKVKNSKAPTALFTLLEALEPGNSKLVLSLLDEVVESTEDIIVFTMIARQISYLIMMKSGTSPKFAPWQMGKLRAQAQKWNDKQLETFISELLKIDLAVKTGATKLTYKDHLDILILNLLG